MFYTLLLPLFKTSNHFFRNTFTFPELISILKKAYHLIIKLEILIIKLLNKYINMIIYKHTLKQCLKE